MITKTGMRSEMCKLAGMIASAKEIENPLQRQPDTLGKSFGDDGWITYPLPSAAVGSKRPVLLVLRGYPI